MVSRLNLSWGGVVWFSPVWLWWAMQGDRDGERSSEGVWQGSAQVPSVCASSLSFLRTWGCSRFRKKCHFLGGTAWGVFVWSKATLVSAVLKWGCAPCLEDEKMGVSGNHWNPKGGWETPSRILWWNEVLIYSLCLTCLHESLFSPWKNMSVIELLNNEFNFCHKLWLIQVIFPALLFFSCFSYLP